MDLGARGPDRSAVVGQGVEGRLAVEPYRRKPTCLITDPRVVAIAAFAPDPEFGRKSASPFDVARRERHLSPVSDRLVVARTCRRKGSVG
jgi:hypothetical protein